MKTELFFSLVCFISTGLEKVNDLAPRRLNQPFGCQHDMNGRVQTLNRIQWKFYFKGPKVIVVFCSDSQIVNAK